ncbi:MAG: hypothetical protein KIT84_16915 [Labilithrix sp.]|nr:hypothetical protein [Labilithrix sp.]MCW5812711.1 hypothetical protein [Labilithrix sp.]
MVRRILFPALLIVGCKAGPMAKIEALRDALASGDDAALREAVKEAPACTEQPPPAADGAYPPSCLSSIANALGSKAGFVANPPDHAGAATAALVLARDGRGDALPRVDTWLADLRDGKGTGHDALRLAVAKKMAEAAPAVGRKHDAESTRPALRAVVSAVPGACPTYWLVATDDASKLPPELTPDHSACVQRDLARREGPGGAYGAGMPRALEGALAIWRETERALRLGAPNASPSAKATIESKLAVIEAATQKIETERVDVRTSAATIAAIGEAHAEAGVAITPRADAGPPPPHPLRRP